MAMIKNLRLHTQTSRTRLTKKRIQELSEKCGIKDSTFKVHPQINKDLRLSKSKKI